MSLLHSVSAEQGVIWKFGSFAMVALLVDENSLGFLYNNVMNGYGVTDAWCSLFIERFGLQFARVEVYINDLAATCQMAFMQTASMQ